MAPKTRVVTTLPSLPSLAASLWLDPAAALWGEACVGEDEAWRWEEWWGGSVGGMGGEVVRDESGGGGGG